METIFNKVFLVLSIVGYFLLLSGVPEDIRNSNMNVFIKIMLMIPIWVFKIVIGILVLIAIGAIIGTLQHMK